MVRPSFSNLLAIVLCGALFSGFVQQSPESQGDQRKPTTTSSVTETESALVLKVTTRLVVIDVVATDHRGLPVTDLRLDEFKVTEDGNQEAIRVFSFQQPSGRPTHQPAQVVAASVPHQPNLVTNVRRLSRTGPLNVLLLDGINTRMNNQEYVRTELLQFLTKLPADQPLAVYALGSRLILLQDFTSDPAVLKDVILHLKDFRSPLMDNAAGGPERFDYEGFPIPTQAIKDRLLEFQQERDSAQADIRVAITVSALDSLARTLAGYPGRKNLIWVSESFPFSIVPNLKPTGASAERARRNYSDEVASMANLFTDAEIAVYPVDARALVNSDVFNPSVQYDPRGDRIGGAGQMQRQMDDLSDELMAARGTMQSIAEDTGGQAFYNRNDIGNAVRRSIEDGSTYYTLGYYPQSKSWDNRFRRINVKVSRPGVTLRYRTGYYAVAPDAYTKRTPQWQDAEFGRALSPEVPISTALAFAAQVIPPTEETGNKVLVNFLIDAHALSFWDESGGKKHARAECAVRVFQGKKPGAPLKTEANSIDADLPPDSYGKVMQAGLPCQTTVDLPAGEYLLRLGVRDNQTGLIGTVNTQLAIPGEKKN